MSTRALGVWVWVVLAALAVESPVRAQPSPDEIRRAAGEVFERPEFRPAKSSRGPWLVRQFVAFVEWLGSLRAAAPVLFWLLLIGCILAIVGLVAFVVYKVTSSFARDRDRPAGAAAGRAERERRSAAYRAEADRRAEAGDYTEAVRFLFLSLVYRFDERGRVEFDKAYTNREYLELLGDRVSGRDALGQLVNTLDDHWYGQVPCGRPEYERCRAAYDRLAAAA